MWASCFFSHHFRFRRSIRYGSKEKWLLVFSAERERIVCVCEPPAFPLDSCDFRWDVENIQKSNYVCVVQETGASTNQTVSTFHVHDTSWSSAHTISERSGDVRTLWAQSKTTHYRALNISADLIVVVFIVAIGICVLKMHCWLTIIMTEKMADLPRIM